MAERTTQPTTNGTADAATSPGKDAVAVWQEKLEFLLEKEAVLAAPAQQFELRKQIEEAEEKIRELTAAPPPTPSPRDPENERHTRRLKELYTHKKKLTLAGSDITDVTNEILDVRRLVRRGPLLGPGDLLADGRFELLETVGQGGFATVWKAWDNDANNTGGQLVALKVLHSHHGQDRSRRERFFRGACQMAKLRHDHVVTVLETKPAEHGDDGWFFFTMEYVAGGTFEQAIRAGRLTRSDQLTVLQQVGDALAFAHDRGVVHRDVKPANILLDENSVAKLTDFDLVRADDTTGFTATRAMLGTLQFAAPEALESAAEAGVRADVYSLASTAVFALLDGKLPARYYRAPERVIAELPQVALRPVLARATAFETEERFASVQAFCEALIGAWSPSSSSEPDPGAVVDGPLGMRFRFIPKGTFQMGSPTNEPDRGVLETLHDVKLTRGLWMGETVVTQGQWQTLMENNPVRRGESHPVSASWYDAVTFANRLSETDNLEPCYELVGCMGTPGKKGYVCENVELRRDCDGYRLPTEAEWERAARAGGQGLSYSVNGNDNPELESLAWYDANNIEGTTHPISQKAANEWGLFDMLGNVWECAATPMLRIRKGHGVTPSLQRARDAFSVAARG